MPIAKIVSQFYCILYSLNFLSKEATIQPHSFIAEQFMLVLYKLQLFCSLNDIIVIPFISFVVYINVSNLLYIT